MSTYSNTQPSIIPLPMPSYSYRYPNSDSHPYSSLSDRVGIYNPTLPGIYKWETHFSESNRNLTYLGPDFFKEPPKNFALSSNWPKENYSPLHYNINHSSKGDVPHFTNKTNQEWKKFLNETTERKNLSKSAYSKRIDFDIQSNSLLPRTEKLNPNEVAKTEIGADFTQRPVMALSSKFRNNDGYKHSSLYNINNWKPYGNTQAYFNNYIMGAPKFS